MGETTRFVIRSGRTTLYFGAGAVEELKGFLEDFKHVCIVTGRKSARVSGALGDLEKLLGEIGVESVLFDRVAPNPTTKIVDELARFAWENGAEALVAVGGGSVIDSAKIASAIIVCGGRAEDYLRGKRKPARTLPIYAINLTHGTGSEIDRYAVATVENTGEKLGASITYPRASVDDPRYTLSLPRNQSIYTSLDAFYHAYESATSNLSSPYVNMMCLETVKLIGEQLPRLDAGLSNLECREKLLYASMLAGIAIDHSSTHIVHAIEHALSGIQPKLAHGAGLAIIGPRAVFHVHKAVPEKSARILKPIAPHLKGVPEEAEEAMRAVKGFQEKSGFDERLSDYGFGKDDLKLVLELVLDRLKRMWSESPLQLTREIVTDIYVSSL